MSENKNYDENAQFDELNIKVHLNDSLDLSGISVSEDLINRTLLAIKKQTELQAVTEINESQSENNTTNQISAINLNQTDEIKEQKASGKKVIQWNRYIRAFAGVAAAMIVVVVGYSLASNGAFSGYKTSSSRDQAYDTATKEEADKRAGAEISESATIFEGEESVGNALIQNENASAGDTSVNPEDEEPKAANGAEPDSNYSGAAAGGGGGTTGTDAESGTKQYSIVAEVPITMSKADSAGSSSDSSADKGNAALQDTETSMKKSVKSQEIALSFRDIFLAEPTKASTLTVTDEINNVSVILTKKEDIKSFYSMMEKHQFTYGDQTGDTSNYVIEIVTPTPSMTRYTMYVGTSIVVDYADDVTSSHSVYTTSTLSELSDAIQEFCQKHSK